MNLIERLESMANWAARGREIYGVRPDVLSEADARSSEAIETVRAMQEALYKLEEAAQDSNDAQYGTLSTRFVLDLIQTPLRRTEGNAG